MISFFSSRNRQALGLLGAVALGIALGGPAAVAQKLEPGQTVLDRPRPETDPLGVRAGGFLVYPSLTLEERYNSNVFAEPDDDEGDFITSLRPEVNAQSQWANHALNFQTGADLGIYADNTDENYFDWNVGFDGRVDIRRDTNVFGGASWSHEHEERGSPEDVNGEEPTEFDVGNLTAGGFQRFNRLSFRLTGTYDRYDYDDVGAAGAGIINNDDRDRDEVEATLRGAYEIQPNFNAFVEGSYNVRDYDSDVDDTGVDRDSDGYQIALGSEFDLTGITFGEAYIGYRSQEPDDPALDTTSGISGGASLTSNVTQLTSVQLGVTSAVQETTQPGAAAIFSRGVNLRVDHELLRSLLLNANAAYANNDYEGIDRVDHRVRAGFGATYLMNRYLNFGAGYTFEGRRSDVDAVEFDQHIFQVSATLQY